MRKTERGITLLEMLVTLAIAAVLLGLGVPSFERMLVAAELRTRSQELVFGAMRAREHAVIFRTHVVLCPSIDGATCLAEPHWHRGWISFEDTDDDRALDPSERLIEQHVASARGITLVSSRSRRRMRFYPAGWAWGSNTTIRVCAPGNRIPGRRLILSGTGRMRTADATSDTCD
ncbi:MAG: GspH/FimT family pseudopilin [Pseudomonadota bacterium]